MWQCAIVQCPTLFRAAKSSCFSLAVSGFSFSLIFSAVLSSVKVPVPVRNTLVTSVSDVDYKPRIGTIGKVLTACKVRFFCNLDLLLSALR